MPGDHVRAQRRVVVLVELRPVERDDDLLARSDHERRPRRRQLCDVDRTVAQEPVDLLDPVARLGPRHFRVRLADRVDRQRRGAQHPRHAVGQRLHALDVKVVLEQLGCEPLGVKAIELAATLGRHGALGRLDHAPLNRAPRSKIPRPLRFLYLTENKGENGGISQASDWTRT